LRDLRYETRLMTMPEIATSSYLDTFGNTVRRFIAPAGDLTLSRDAVVGCLAGYADVTGAERLRHDAAMRWRMCRNYTIW
jgi:hypothetical protein